MRTLICFFTVLLLTLLPACFATAEQRDDDMESFPSVDTTIPPMLGVVPASKNATTPTTGSATTPPGLPGAAPNGTPGAVSGAGASPAVTPAAVPGAGAPPAVTAPAASANATHGTGVTDSTPPATETPGATVDDPPAPPQPFALPPRKVEIPQRFCLGVYQGVPVPDDTERVRATVLSAAKEWHLPAVYLAWYAADKKPGQGVALMACTLDGKTVSIQRPAGPVSALDLEKRLALPITPKEIAQIYLDNEVVADDDFKGKPVIFESEVADIARGAFGRPYVFFPAEPGGVSGLTCYFDAKDPALRQLRKGSRVTVRAEVKGFLMQDVILDKCMVLDIKQ